MKHFSILIIIGLFSLSSASLRAQSREIGARSLQLDDGSGHLVDIVLPSGLAGGPYTWTLPITVPGGVPMVLPTGTVANSTIRWDAPSTSWLENTNVTATSAGVLTAASNINTTGGAYQIGGSTVLSDGGTQNIFVGVGAGITNVTGNDNTALGYNAEVGTGSSDATAIGVTAQATANFATALGFNANATQTYTTALGYGAWASVGANATAIGASTYADGAYSTALGYGAQANVPSGTNGTAIGSDAAAIANYATALGYLAEAAGINSTAIGYDARTNLTSGTNATAIGVSTYANGTNATALGYGATASADNTIQLGNTSVTLVNTSGNIVTSGTITASTGASGLVLGSGTNATTLTSTASAARAISFPDKSGTVALKSDISGGAILPATVPTNPNPIFTTNLSPLQMGLGSFATITPSTSGKVLITVSGECVSGSGNLCYGTGSAPHNGDPAAGTAVGGQFSATTSVAPFSSTVVVNLTVGTTYWIDVQLAEHGNLSSITGVSISAIEIP